jgi:hypothetical protein
MKIDEKLQNWQFYGFVFMNELHYAFQGNK